jgi:hypothetical protein
LIYSRAQTANAGGAAVSQETNQTDAGDEPLEAEALEK